LVVRGANRVATGVTRRNRGLLSREVVVVRGWTILSLRNAKKRKTIGEKHGN
jgi:hypothetical protein